MRDLIIKVKRQKTEIIVLVICFLLAIALNVGAIIIYKTQWKELYTQLHVAILLALFLYLLTWVVRLVYSGIKTAWLKISKR
jgi:hypothetical protein